MCALDDEETQRRGIACIIYGVGEFSISRTDLKTVVQGAWVQSVVPVKTCSLHHCFSDTTIRRFINVSMMFFGEQTKARAKMHHGTSIQRDLSLLIVLWFPDHHVLVVYIDVTRHACGVCVRTDDVWNTTGCITSHDGWRRETEESFGMDQDAKTAGNITSIPSYPYPITV